MSSLAIRLIENPSEGERRSVLEGLVAFNARHLPDESYMPIALLVESADGTSRGGLVGSIYWNALAIDMLWLDETIRGQGIGRALLQEAEAYARSRACALIHLDTMSFQARGFYEKQGYRLFGALTGYPNGVERYYMVKHLDARTAQEAAA